MHSQARLAMGAIIITIDAIQISPMTTAPLRFTAFSEANWAKAL
jgi:hypothetical protein